MADAGYSGTPLQKKLGLKEGWTVAFVGEVPPDFGERFQGLDIQSHLRAPLDAVHLFVASETELRRRAPGAMKVLADTGILWVSWPKKASGVPTDLTEQTLRDVLLPTGWVDTKVCAVDETWSGLLFRKRLSERAGTPRTPTAGRR